MSELTSTPDTPAPVPESQPLPRQQQEAAANKSHERRSFARIDYRAYAALASGGRLWHGHLLDLSFSGALVALIHRHNIREGDDIILTIETGANEDIEMQGKVVHLKDHFLGIECRAAGIDQQARLRELVGKQRSPEQMQRALQQMLDKDSY